jgi:hypothetical protein
MLEYCIKHHNLENLLRLLRVRGGGMIIHFLLLYFLLKKCFTQKSTFFRVYNTKSHMRTVRLAIIDIQN